MSEVSNWIAKLWPAVCARARRPVTGVRLDQAMAGGVAEAVFEDFLETFPRAPGSWETVQHWKGALNQFEILWGDRIRAASRA